MKKLLLSRRGAAIEMAIGVMLLMIAVSIVLLTLSTIKHDRKEDDVAQLENRIELNEIGEYVCANRNSYTKDEPETIIIDGKDTGYSVSRDLTISSDRIRLIITENDGNNTVLTILLDSEGDIISWK